MPSKSRSQQRLFGMVHACQKTGKCASPEVSKIAGSISDKDAEDFARTKHDGLPERKVKKKKKKKHKLKSFKEFREHQILSELDAQGRQMAGMMQGDDLNQLHQQATQSGVNTSKYFRVMSKWLNEIEEKLNLRGQQSGEQANNWHQQAVQVLQAALNMAAGGKQQWQMSRQLKNAKVAAQNAQANLQQHPQQQQLGGNAGAGKGPTPLDSIA